MNASLQTMRSGSRLLTATLILAGIVAVSFSWWAGAHPGETHGVCVAAVLQDSACPDGSFANLTFHASALAKYFRTTGAAGSLLAFLVVTLLGAWAFRWVRPRTDRLEIRIQRFLRREFRRPPPLQDLGHWLARFELSPNQNQRMLS